MHLSNKMRQPRLFAHLGAAVTPSLLIFLIALGLRLAYVASRWNILPDWNTDAAGYQQLAVNLLQRGVFSLNALAPFQPDSIRTPAYPVFISIVYLLVGITPRAVLVVQALLDSVTALIVMSIARNLTADGKRPGTNLPAFAAGVVYAIDPTAWRYCAELYTETALALVIALAFWLLSHKTRYQAPGLGLACGLTILIKPNAIVLAPILIIGLIMVTGNQNGAAPCVTRSIRLSVGPCIAFAGALALVLAPWVIRNISIFGRPLISTAFEDNLARVSGPATLAAVSGETVAPWSPRWEQLYNEIVQQAADKDPALFAIPRSQMTARQADQAQREIANRTGEIISGHPLQFVQSQLAGALHGWLPQDHQFWYTYVTGETWNNFAPAGIAELLRNGGWRTAPHLALALSIAFPLIYLAGFILSVRGIWHVWRTHSVIALTMLLCVMALTVVPGPIA
jgi:hypothetical protein